MPTSLAEKIRDGYRRAMFIAGGSRGELQRLRSRLRGPALSYRERDHLLAAAIRRYRTEDVRLWGPVLLELLAPAIMARLDRFTAVPPVVDEDDIAQQFLLEVLVAAATMPLPPAARFVERRLIRRAAYLTARWLRREATRQSLLTPLEDTSDPRPADEL
jgi:hypothetical protein